jgi:hypothetical protein
MMMMMIVQDKNKSDTSNERAQLEQSQNHS